MHYGKRDLETRINESTDVRAQQPDGHSNTYHFLTKEARDKFIANINRRGGQANIIPLEA